MAQLLPLLYLHGLSTKDFVPALAEFFGTEAGLSAPLISRLSSARQAECRAFGERDLSESCYVYVWADRIHLKVRLGDDKKLCVLAIMGVRIDGTKQLVALAEGYRESTRVVGGPAAGLPPPRDGRPHAGDRATVPWGSGQPSAASSLKPASNGTLGPQDCQRPERPAHLGAGPGPAGGEITQAENRAEAEKALDRFSFEFGVKQPRAAAKITVDREELLASSDFPAEHWIHLRTSNPIESTFAPVRARSNLTKDGLAGGGPRDGLQAGPGGRAAVAAGERPGARCPGRRGCQVRQRKAGRGVAGEEWARVILNSSIHNY